LRKEIERKYTQEVLDIGKTRFFALVKEYRKDPNRFSIQYTRNSTSRKIPHYAEDTIIRELQTEKNLIEDPEIPLRHYNYSYIKDILETKYYQKVSLPIIIDRAKKNDIENLSNVSGYALVEHLIWVRVSF